MRDMDVKLVTALDNMFPEEEPTENVDNNNRSVEEPTTKTVRRAKK